jgi:hypothetical protein
MDNEAKKWFDLLRGLDAERRAHLTAMTTVLTEWQTLPVEMQRSLLKIMQRSLADQDQGPRPEAFTEFVGGLQL